MPANARSACEQHRLWIEEQVYLGRNAVSIYQDLVEQFAFEHKYNSVKRFCRALRKKDPVQYDRLEFPPGEDYGKEEVMLRCTSVALLLLGWEPGLLHIISLQRL